MALVPHKITALAESDAQGTDGKNIVAGAVVSLYDTEGNAVTLFDDENGTNGSTAKQTDATGQVVVYVEQGEYDEEVNGSVRRRVLIGSAKGTITSYATTAELEALRPNKTGDRIENRERANAQYVLAEDGYTALPGDLTAANGRVWALQINGSANVRWFGFNPANDAVSNFPLFQDAIDRVVTNGGGEVFIPYQGAEYDGYKYGKAPRIVEPNITVRCESPDTKLICTGFPGDGTGSWPNVGCVILGTILQSENIPYFNIEDITQSDDSIVLSAIGEDSNFSEGDVIYICSNSEYSVGKPRQTYGQMNVVTSISSGEIGLRYPIQESISGCRVQNYTRNTYEWTLSNGVNPDSKVEYSKAPRDCKILGGTWIAEKDAGPFNGGSGAIDCIVDVHRVEARSGVAYGNQFAHCLLKANTQVTRKSGTELAFNCHNNTVEINSDINKPKNGFSEVAQGAVWLNEGARENSININYLDSGEVAHNSLVAVVGGNGNTVNINKARAAGITNVQVRIRDAALGDDRPNCSNNTIKISNSSHVGSLPYYVEINNNGKLFSNKVLESSFKGDVTNAVLYDSTGGSDVIDGCNFEKGQPVLIDNTGQPTISNSFFADGVYPELGLVTGSEKVITSNVTSNLKRLLSKADVMQTGSTSTNASPFSLTSEIPANALQFGDRVEFSVSCFIPGGSSPSNKTVNFTFGGFDDSTYTTNSTGASEIIIRGFLYKGSNTNLGISYYIMQDDSTASTRVFNRVVPDITINLYCYYGF